MCHLATRRWCTILADVSVTLHEAQVRSVVDSAVFSGRETCLEECFRETEAFGADCVDVSVWEYVELTMSEFTAVHLVATDVFHFFSPGLGAQLDA